MWCITEAAENFHYTNQGDAVELDDVCDSNEFAATQEALSLLGLSTELQRSLLRVLAAILHLGNVAIFQKDDDSQINVCSNLVSMVLPKQVLKSFSVTLNIYTLYICV